MSPSIKISYSVDEAAAAIGIGRTKLYELIGEHKLTTFKIGARTLIRRDVLEQFQETANEQQVNEDAPSPAPMATCGIYMLWSAGAAVYVGRSTTLRSRIGAHRRSGRIFDEVRVIPCDADTSVWLEKELIRTLRPSQNLLRYARHAAIAERAIKRQGLQ